MAVVRYTRSIPDIFTDVLSQVTTLVRQESQLARAELSENVSRAALGLGLVIAGAVLLIPAIVVLLQAAVAALVDEYGMAPAWSALIVGGLVLLLGLILAAVGASRLKVENMMPNKTIHQLRRDATVAKNQMREPNEVQRAA